MKFDLSKPTYAQTLKLVRHSLGMDHVLPSFWRRRVRWPASDQRMIFLLDAIDCAGRAKFPDSWTGKEFSTYQHVPEYDSFAHTVENYRARVAQWKMKDERADRESKDMAPVPLARPDRSADEVGEAQPKSRSQRRADHIGALQLHAADLEAGGEKYRSQYHAALIKWAEFTEENAAALKRLRWALDWIADQARDGAVATFLRRASTDTRPGPYHAVPEGFWNVDTAIEQWLYAGDLEYDLFELDRRENTSTSMGRYYVFLDRKTFDRSLLALGNRMETSPDLTDVYLSPYMLLAIAVVREEGLTQSYQSKIDNIRETAMRLAPRFGIVPEDKKTLLKYIGTIVRDPESEKGRRPREDRDSTPT